MKHRLFWFLFLILVNLFCYAPNTIASPIINGKPDENHFFKFHVSIHNREDLQNVHEHVCSGNIISERYILTAAHCFITILNGVIEEILYPRGTTKIIAGTNLRNGPGIERDLIRVFIPSEYDVHKDYRSGLLITEADIAVAELNADLGIHQNPSRLAIMPLGVLDPHSNAGVDEQATFCGFGQDRLVHNHPRDSDSNINRFMEVKILGRDKCRVFNTSICAINSDKRIFRTSCLGDSGSGLVYKNKIVGILNIGPHNCNTLEAIVFARLSEYMRFIEEAQNPHGDHSNMMILDEIPKSPLKRYRSPRTRDESSSNSAGGKRKPPQVKNYHV